MDKYSTELVTVLQATDRAMIAVAKSILMSAGIRCFEPDELLNSNRGVSRCGGIQIQVSARDSEDARQLLADLVAERPNKLARWYARVVLVVTVIGIIISIVMTIRHMF